MASTMKKFNTLIFFLIQLILQVTSLPTADSLGVSLSFNSPTNPIVARGEFNGRYLCETTSGSPRVGSIGAAADKLDALSTDTMCRQLNQHIGGSHCSRLATADDAELGICGDDHQSQWIMCYMVAYAAKVIRDNCEWNGLAGGIFWFDDVPKCSIIVYHS